MRWVLILLFCVLAIGGIAWKYENNSSDLQKQKTDLAARHKAPTLVTLVRVQRRDLVGTFSAEGNIEAPLDVKIAPKVTGRIELLQVHEGDHVKKGQVLARLDKSQVEAAVQQAQANLAQAQFQLAQAQLTQVPTNVGISTQIRQQKAGVNSAQADYEQVKTNYDAQLAAANAGTLDVQGRIESANAGIESAHASIASAQSNLDNATTRLNRTLALYKQGFVAAQDVDDAKAAVSVQQANVTVAQAQLKSVQAQLKSAQAQKQATEQQASIVKTKGKADIEAAQARLTQSQASLESATANSAQTKAYQQSLAALQAAVDAAKAALANAISQRADTVLTSPLDGVVTGRYADPGAMASSSQPIVAVQFIDQVWATIAVPDNVCAVLHLGQPATICFDALPGKTFTASIVQLNPAADPTSRQFTVRVILRNDHGLLKPGMFANVILETAHVPAALVVPREAVHRDRDGSQYAMVLAGDGTAQKRTVLIGASDTNYLQVHSGLAKGEQVVTLSPMPLTDGQPITAGKTKAAGTHGKKE